MNFSRVYFSRDLVHFSSTSFHVVKEDDGDDDDFHTRATFYRTDTYTYTRVSRVAYARARSRTREILTLADYAEIRRVF